MNVFSIIVDISTQTLILNKDGQTLKNYLISTGKNGCGQEANSFQTPLGKHIIRAKIGTGAPKNMSFSGRRSTGDIFTPQLFREQPNRDWILSRILWLSGTEPKYNRLGNVDTMRRFIYIHGGPDEGIFGKPDSKGCIRMKNDDVIELYDLVPVYTSVNIVNNL